MRKNEGTYDEALLLIMERNGYPEETYYTFSYSPVPNDRGGSGGILCANTEDTRRIVGERQLALLRELAARTADARTFDEACTRCAACLESNPRDLPFAMIYLVEPARRRVVLCGTAGIARGHPAAPESVDLDAAGPWPFAEVLRTNRPVVVEDPARVVRSDAHRRLGPAAGPRGRRPDRAVGTDGPRRASWSPASIRSGSSTAIIAGSSNWSPARSPPASPMPRPTRRSANAPRRWPSSTAPRRPSSPTSATSSAPR